MLSGIVLPPGFKRQKIKDSQIIIHPNKPAWIALNSVGWKIIQLLDQQKKISDIVSVLQSTAQIGPDFLEKDIHKFIE